ncbi:MAG: DNA mismatch repair protein MutS, partial [Deltaproteobacteria bacterium]
GRVRGLFATHYHEMTTLADKLQGIENATVTVKEWDQDIIFLHEIKKGAADRSDGVQVAKLAGLPDSVIVRARMVLDALEQGDREGKGQKGLIDDLPLFSTKPAPPARVAQRNSPALDRINAILPDTLTPLDALNLIYELKALTESE